MIRLFTSSLAFCLLFFNARKVFSQEFTAIYGSPAQYQGYMLLDGLNFPTVTQWNIEVRKKTSTEDSSVLIKMIKTPENYIKLDIKDYSSKDKLIVVNGIDNQGRKITTDTYDPYPHALPYPPPDWFWPYSSKVCIFDTYALRIIIEAKHSGETNEIIGGSMIELWGAGSDEIATINQYQDTIYKPYYQYMTDHQFNDLLVAHSDYDDSHIFSWTHHSFNPSDEYNYSVHGPDGITIAKLPNPTQSAYQDYEGINIAEPYVYAVQKGMGDWNSDAGFEYSPTLANDAGSLAGSLSDYNGYREIANNYIPFEELGNPLLAPCSSEGESGDSDAGGAESGCGELFDDWDNQEFDNAYDMFSDYLASDCMSEVDWVSNPIPDSSDTGEGVVWPNNHIKYIQLYKVNYSPEDKRGGFPTGKVLELCRDSVYNNDGSLNLPSFELAKGLYNMLLIFEDNSTLPVLFELKENTQNVFELSNVLTANIYPVPFENFYSIELNVASTVSFTYSVYDTQNEILFEKRIKMKKGETLLLNKISAENFPTGQIFHKFVFKDGSEKIITTIKN